MPAPHTPLVIIEGHGYKSWAITTDQRLADYITEIAEVDLGYEPDEAFIEEQKDWVRHIVHCVNTHSALVEALRATLPLVREAYAEAMALARSADAHGLETHGDRMREEAAGIASLIAQVTAALATQPQP